MNCYPRMLTAREIYFQKFVHENVFLRGLYNKSLKDWSRGKQLILFPTNLNVFLGRLSGKKSTFSVGTSHQSSPFYRVGHLH